MAIATTGIVEGHKMGIYIGGSLIAATLTKSVKQSRATRSINNDDSGDSEKIAMGRIKTVVSGRSHWEFDATYGYRDLFAAMKAGTLLTVVSGTDEVGDYEYSGTGYLTQLDATHPDHENSEYDWTIEISGDWTETEITT